MARLKYFANSFLNMLEIKLSPSAHFFALCTTGAIKSNSSIFPTNSLVCLLFRYSQRHSTNILKAEDIKVKGFKEVHYCKSETLDFLKEVFPEAQFIINYRLNLQAQSHSGYWARGKKNGGLPEIERCTKNILKWANTNKDRVYLLPLENFNKVNFDKLFGWLGFPRCRANRVVQANKKGSPNDADNSLYPLDCTSKISSKNASILSQIFRGA